MCFCQVREAARRGTANLTEDGKEAKKAKGRGRPKGKGTTQKKRKGTEEAEPVEQQAVKKPKPEHEVVAGLKQDGVKDGEQAPVEGEMGSEKPKKTRQPSKPPPSEKEISDAWEKQE